MGKLKDGKQFSPEFIFMQKRNKAGENNPNFGKIKSPETLAKLTKLVYVYNYDDMSIIGSYSTVDCAKTFKLGKDTLSKYIKSGSEASLLKENFIQELNYIIKNNIMPL
jgi:hypothetical protein